MNKYDEQRRTKTINTLLKAKECLETERIYLSVQAGTDEELFKIHMATEHLDIAVDKLTSEEGEGS